MQTVALDTVAPDLETLAAELREELVDGSLGALGPIALTVGAHHDAELAAKVVLADLEHLLHLREHTGREAGAGRWALVAADLRLLLEAGRMRRAVYQTSGRGERRSPR